MDIGEARAIVREKTTKDITMRHLVSVEGVMRRLARHFGEDEDRWALTGLFHDLDQDVTADDPERHAYLAASWLRERDVDAAALVSSSLRLDRHPRLPCRAGAGRRRARHRQRLRADGDA